ncbi:NAD(+)--rifampin ADP-ribosyltransferase [Solimonas variicoloris]|uniref:NAD(+)--rifampin ADP-ribosyltransferase n=1 Tax=Solimonas variicoloris TaxID=254408 RepID=UPI00037417F7|nr:NAD(+)--rifampin ADP-ribosyltransferase [Solimonas variicoloris]
MEIGPDLDWIPCTYENYVHISGPFYHGTAVALAPGTLLVPGFESNYQKGRVSRNVYFTALPMPAAGLAAELAVVLTGAEPPGHIYVVEPTGPFEDDPNVTNRRFAGNPTKSYRSIHPLRIVEELRDWPRSDPERIATMLANLERMRQQGLQDLIDD